MLSIRSNANISDQLRSDLNRILRGKYPEGEIKEIKYIDERNMGTRRAGTVFVHFKDEKEPYKPCILAVDDKKKENQLYRLIDK